MSQMHSLSTRFLFWLFVNFIIVSGIIPIIYDFTDHVNYSYVPLLNMLIILISVIFLTMLIIILEKECKLILPQ